MGTDHLRGSLNSNASCAPEQVCTGWPALNYQKSMGPLETVPCSIQAHSRQC